MCGRFTQTVGVEALRKRFGFEQPTFDLRPRYNLAPTQDAPVVLERDGNRRLELFRWGLVPSWSKDPKTGYKLINARAETAATKPSFRRCFAKRRCLVPADGFYEWKRVGEKLKWPMRVVLRSREPFAFAGLWDEWKQPDGKPLHTFTILTTDAPPSLRSLHDRVPVILPPEGEAAWLDPRTRPEALTPLLAPPPDDRLEAYPVSPLVNTAKTDEPACIEPCEPRPPGKPEPKKRKAPDADQPTLF